MSQTTLERKGIAEFAPLEELLEGLASYGEFFSSFSQMLPMPQITIEGVGLLSFPLLPSQVREVIEQAHRAPYGRGEETIFDTSVRKTWQMGPDQVQISGKLWPTQLAAIVDEVKNGLGCQEMTVSDEFYKLLIYDEGSFFLSHRDSEKGPGMFGTMVIVLPSAHEGGELVIRHKGKEVQLDLSGAEGSELKIAAFYADCEHEVLPIKKGYRACLVYNLINHSTQRKIHAPYWGEEIDIASEILNRAFAAEMAPTKLVWLLDHQYTQAELSFSSLKNKDASVAQVLLQAAKRANCPLYLGIVHIEESGDADADFGYYSRTPLREKEVTSADYEVLEISDTLRYVDELIDADHQLLKLEQLPVEEDELLPQEALEGIEPDEERLLEATGNAGVTFERAYHCAALIFWPKKNHIDVLLQSSPAAAIAYLKEELASSRPMQELKELALKVMEVLEQDRTFYRIKGEGNVRAELLAFLTQLEDETLIARFISGAIQSYYDGSENYALAAAAEHLGPLKMGDIFYEFFKKWVVYYPCLCVKLYQQMSERFLVTEKAPIFKQPFEQIFYGIVQGSKSPSLSSGSSQRLPRSQETWNSSALVDLWRALEHLGKEMYPLIAQVWMENPLSFDPRNIITPALERLSPLFKHSPPLQSLWEHVATSLLQKSENPPQVPTDWKQESNISCSCSDCSELKKFISNPVEHMYAFQMAQNRRDHLSQQIFSRHRDMEMETDTSRRPYKLICKKTRKIYQQKYNEYAFDVEAMKSLVAMMSPSSDQTEMTAVMLGLHDRLRQAIFRREMEVVSD